MQLSHCSAIIIAFVFPVLTIAQPPLSYYLSLVLKVLTIAQQLLSYRLATA